MDEFELLNSGISYLEGKSNCVSELQGVHAVQALLHHGVRLAHLVHALLDPLLLADISGGVLRLFYLVRIFIHAMLFGRVLKRKFVCFVLPACKRLRIAGHVQLLRCLFVFDGPGFGS